MDFANLFPASSNAAYDGSILSAWYLGLMAVLTIGPGCIHNFLKDGGAQSIAGLRLERHQRLIVHLFAWAGATQIVWGLADGGGGLALSGLGATGAGAAGDRAIAAPLEHVDRIEIGRISPARSLCQLCTGACEPAVPAAVTLNAAKWRRR